MNINTASKVNKGAMLALGAAALILAGCASAGQKSASTGAVHCAGINSCKGTSACKTATNACKGQNSCKGQGFLETPSAEECTTKGGKVI